MRVPEQDSIRPMLVRIAPKMPDFEPSAPPGRERPDTGGEGGRVLQGRRRMTVCSWHEENHGRECAKALGHDKTQHRDMKSTPARVRFGSSRGCRCSDWSPEHPRGAVCSIPGASRGRGSPEVDQHHGIVAGRFAVESHISGWSAGTA
jgi:hypothetical protein